MKFNFLVKTKLIFILLLQLLLIITNGVQSCASRKPVIDPAQPKPESNPATAANSKNTVLRCQDELGRPLTWFIAYKIAKVLDSSLPRVKKGLGYSFLTNGSDEWKLSTHSIRDQTSILSNSLKPLYNKRLAQDSKTLYILYNDQPPNKTSVGYNGHMKGILLANERGGIWLQHSLPKFPDRNGHSQESYTYPSNGENNAQLFFCMTLTPQNIDEIVANTLLHTKPVVYEHSVPESMKKIYPNLAKLVATGRKKNTPPSQMFSLIDGDLNLTIFAKGPKFEKEIYSDWIAPTLDSGLKVQSWLNGVNSLQSNCKTKYQILNISEKQLDTHQFSTQKDHSKWAISSRGKWTCISDLNRMESQKSRGGAALCTTDEKIWNSFQKSVLDVQACGRPTKSSGS